MVASWERSIESIRALKMADLVWWYSLSRAIASGLRTSITSSAPRSRAAASGVARGATSVARGATGAGLGDSATAGALPPKLVRLPNMVPLPFQGSRPLALLEQIRKLQAARLAPGFGGAAPHHVHGDRPIDFVAAVVGRNFGNHLPVVGCRSEDGGIERDLAQQLAIDRGGELRRADLGAARHAELVDDQQGCALGRPQGLDGI